MKLGVTILIHNKDDIDFVTEFPCLLGHPKYLWSKNVAYYYKNKIDSHAILK